MALTRVTSKVIQDGTISTADLSTTSKSSISGSFRGELSSSVHLRQVASTISGSIPQALSTTSSPTFNNITATGTLTAQEIHTEFTSASILFTSGSTKTGNSTDDIHQMTGSLNISGSLDVNDGNLSITDKMVVGSGSSFNFSNTNHPFTVRSSGNNVGFSVLGSQGTELLRFIQESNDSGKLDIYDGGSLKLRLSGHANETNYINNGGDVGIGIASTTSYYEKVLHIHESAGSSAIHLTNNTTGTTRDDGTDLIEYQDDFYIWSRESGGNILIGTNATERLRISGSGEAIFSSDVKAAKFEAYTTSTTDPVLILGDQGVADYNWTFPDTGTIKLSTSTSSSKKLFLKNDGSGEFNFEIDGTLYIPSYLEINRAAQNGIKIKTDDTAVIWVYDKTSDAITGGVNWGHSDGTTIFYTGGTTERMRLTSGGRLGIGESSPNNAIHVVASTNSTDDGVYPVIFTENGNASGNSYAGFKTRGRIDGSNNVDCYFLADGANSLGFIGTNTNTNFEIRTNGNTAMRFTNGLDIVVPGANQNIYFGGTRISGEHDSSRRRLKQYGSGDNYMTFGCYEDNGYGYIENYGNSVGLYFWLGQTGSDMIIDADSSSSFRPYQDEEFDLGESSYRFDDVYASNGTIQTSDKRMKDNIKVSSLGLDFINKLNPVQYKWKDYEAVKPASPDGQREEKTIKHTYERTHYGLIAQEVEKVLTDSGLTTKDFAPITYDEEADRYGMRYTELVGILIKGMQELSAKVEALES